MVMRSNSGLGKSNNNLRDPTMKEHEKARHKGGHAERGGDAEPVGDDLADRPLAPETGPIDKH
jgi:hypothetical protein